jgi:non-specific serine/threonine protein kinase
MGKTRLALHLATITMGSFPDGVYLIELATLTEPALVPQAIASALNIHTDQDSPLLSLLTPALEKHHSLLIFDNCEHVLEACISLIEALLHTCPLLHILATSREPLHIAEETAWRVAALSFPHSEQIPPIEQLAHYEAIQLFCQRAAESDPRFHLTEQNAPAIVRICHQLDGLPLALELTTARLSMLSVDQLATRLDERFVLLTRGQRTAPSRQQTLHATLDWSYALLTPAEQALFQRLAIFVGNWNLDDIEQVIGPATTTPYTLSDVLTHLVNKSLVIAEEQEETGEIRYRLLNTIQHYAMGKLMQSGNWQHMYNQHQIWYLHLAEEANTYLHGPEQIMWLQYLETEMPNIRIALTRALAAQHIDTAAQLAEAVRRFWITRNHFSEGRHWFETLLATSHGDKQLSPSLQACVLFGTAEFARYQGAYERACTLLEDLIALLQTLDDLPRLVEAQTYLGITLGLLGDYEQAQQLCQTSLDFYRERKQIRGIIQALIPLAYIALNQGKYLQSIALSEEVCPLLRRAGDHSYLLYALFTLAQATILQGKLEQARPICRETLQLSQQLNQSFGQAASLGLIAGIAGLQGQPVQAARLFGASQTLAKRVQAPFPPSARSLQERMAFPARTALGKEQFLSHYHDGQTSSLEQILAEAKAVLETSSTSLIADSPASHSSPSIPSHALATLSQRERETLALVARGLTDAQVAQDLRLSPHTISKHLQSIYAKLHINSRSAATRIALHEGLL